MCGEQERGREQRSEPASERLEAFISRIRLYTGREGRKQQPRKSPLASETQAWRPSATSPTTPSTEAPVPLCWERGISPSPGMPAARSAQLGTLVLSQVAEEGLEVVSRLAGADGWWAEVWDALWADFRMLDFDGGEVEAVVSEEGCLADAKCLPTLVVSSFYILVGLVALLGNALILATLLVVSDQESFRQSCNYLLIGSSLRPCLVERVVEGLLCQATWWS